MLQTRPVHSDRSSVSEELQAWAGSSGPGRAGSCPSGCKPSSQWSSSGSPALHRSHCRKCCYLWHTVGTLWASVCVHTTQTMTSDTHHLPPSEASAHTAPDWPEPSLPFYHLLLPVERQVDHLKAIKKLKKSTPKSLNSGAQSCLEYSALIYHHYNTLKQNKDIFEMKIVFSQPEIIKNGTNK